MAVDAHWEMLLPGMCQARSSHTATAAPLPVDMQAMPRILGVIPAVSAALLLPMFAAAASTSGYLCNPCNPCKGCLGRLQAGLKVTNILMAPTQRL